jgi:hypothetical protein
MQGGVVAEVLVQHHIGQPNHPSDQGQQGSKHGGDAFQLQREGAVDFG